jgi:ABC-type multidrug transport system fused ATPase/permease subunit
VSALHELTHNMATYINNRSGLERFMTIFGKEIIDREKDKIKFSKSFKKIELIDLHFKYKKADVLKGINLTINKGEKIGVVGKSGSGKSTISKLLLGLYNSNKGKILFDKKPIQSYSHNSITNNISIVLQESEMFNLSLLENVTISSTKNNLERFKLASKIANLEPIIEKLPLGLNTKLGEKGYHLSGGERQRVGIARAIYKDNSILILDEATSSLDSKTESLIQKELEKNLKNKTLIIIAHRLSTLKHVDRIIVIDKGKVIEQGRFNQLIKNKGLFSKLYRLQKNR